VFALSVSLAHGRVFRTAARVYDRAHRHFERPGYFPPTGSLVPHPTRFVAPEDAPRAPHGRSVGLGCPHAGADAVPYHFALHFRECGEGLPVDSDRQALRGCKRRKASARVTKPNFVSAYMVSSGAYDNHHLTR
jgi:hypothetical protein